MVFRSTFFFGSTSVPLYPPSIAGLPEFSVYINLSPFDLFACFVWKNRAVVQGYRNVLAWSPEAECFELILDAFIFINYMWWPRQQLKFVLFCMSFCCIGGHNFNSILLWCFFEKYFLPSSASHLAIFLKVLLDTVSRWFVLKVMWNLFYHSMKLWSTVLCCQQ